MVVFGTELKPEDKDTYCLCCNQPHPEEENFKPLACANSELGEMGPGYPLYLELMKKVGYLMLFLTLIYSVPSAVLMYRSYDKIKADLQPDDSSVALFSFGAYVFNSAAAKTYHLE
jgi:hypothetical protein